MRHALRLLLALALVFGPAVGTSRAADIRDILLLKDAGLSDDILIDLIRSDGSSFHLKAADIIDLHQRGLSDRVISAMLATARTPLATPAAPQPQAVPDVPDAPMVDRARVDLPTVPDQEMADAAQPPAGVQDQQDQQEQVEAALPAPVHTQVVEVFVPVAVPVVYERLRVAPPPPPPAPVYWGYGGQKKPGSWDDPQAPAPPTPAKPAAPKGGRGGQ